MFPRTPLKISRRNFWYNKNVRKKNFHRKFYRMWTGNFNVWVWLANHLFFMVRLIIFTKFLDALVSRYINQGTKMPKNESTITRKKDDTSFRLCGAERIRTGKWSNWIPREYDQNLMLRLEIVILLDWLWFKIGQKRKRDKSAAAFRFWLMDGS